MNIIILNGSPKGEQSVTLQYIKYLEKSFPGETFTYIHAARRCGVFEKDQDRFEEVMRQIAAADLVVWSFPLYFLLVHSQYKRFIELIYERNKQDVFYGTHTFSISTSINFFDHTAHNYIRDVCTDFGMQYIDSFPAEMQYIMQEKNRRHFLHFFNRCRERVLAAKAHSAAAGANSAAAGPSTAAAPQGAGWEIETVDERRSRKSPRVSIVTDADSGDSSLIGMIRQIESFFPGTKTINLKQIKMGPCTGCCQCGFENTCVYEGKDDYIEEHRQKVMGADIIIFALSVKDRYLSSYWQRYLERSFYRNHQPSIDGKQVGFLISGPFSENYNIREILTGYTETNGANLIGIVSEGQSPAVLSPAVLAADLFYYFQNDVEKPKSFLGVAGMLIFRDKIFSGLRLLFQQDHKYYRKHGVYDFPQRKVFRRIGISFLSLLLKLPPARRQFKSRMKEGMVSPFKKILAKAAPFTAGESN